MQIKELMDLAIKSEEDSYEFYKKASEISKFSNVKDLLIELSNEELKHKQILISLMEGKITIEEKYLDLKLSDHLPKKEKIDENSTLQDVLQVAMTREKKEYEFYNSLKNKVKENEVKKILEFLSNQELTHKAKLENLYDELIYKEF
ncbi:MAG: ferritin family protein [Thermoplasmata archaeon]